MNERIEFEALRPRRWSAPPPVMVGQPLANVDEPPGNVVFRASEASSEKKADNVGEPPASVDEAPGNVDKGPGNVVFRASQVSSEESSDGIPAEAEDEEERNAIIRDEAIRFAAIACSRALHESLAQDCAVLSRYVDDALRACGRVQRVALRLHPAEAARYRPQRDVDVVADATLMRGEVIVETEAGAVTATVEERAELLARAAAHA